MHKTDTIEDDVATEDLLIEELHELSDTLNQVISRIEAMSEDILTLQEMWRETPGNEWWSAE